MIGPVYHLQLIRKNWYCNDLEKWGLNILNFVAHKWFKSFCELLLCPYVEWFIFSKQNQMFQDLLKTNNNKINLINMSIFHFYHSWSSVVNWFHKNPI